MKTSLRVLMAAVAAALSGLAVTAGAVPLGPGVELAVLDGKAGSAEVALKATGSGAEALGDLVVGVLPARKEAVTVWRVELTDLSKQTRWLELVLTARPGLKAQDATSRANGNDLSRSGERSHGRVQPPQVQYFPGVKPVEVTEKGYETPDYQQALPLAAMWTAGGGIAIGLEPHQEVSYVTHRAKLDAGGPEMSLRVRIVVEPGARREIEFISLPLSGKWDFHEALESFYALAPDIYDPDPAVDPRLSTASAMYAAWQPEAHWEELCRRNDAGWDWCYAPFKRDGDIVGRKEFWDYQPARPFPKTPMPLDSLEKFHAWRQGEFSRGQQGGVAMLFYVPAQTWCEERLAREHYADALTTDPQTKNYFNTPWVTGWDNDIRVLPWNTSWGEQSQRDLAEVAKELDLSGFAFDTCEGVARHFGPHAAQFASRAWDPKLGEYVREAVATAALRGYVHTLKDSRGHHVGVIGNTDLPFYLIARNTDGGLREAAPWTPERGTGDTQRYMMGRKPMVWWQGYDMPALVQYERMTPDQMAEAYVGLSDFVMLECFRIAYLPTVDFTRGVMSAVSVLPTLQECINAGWQPVPSATAAGAGFVTRYGKGLSTRLAIGNETAGTVKTDVIVENGRLKHVAAPWVPALEPEVFNPIPGEGGFVFATLDGQPTRNVVSAETTRVEGVSIASRKVGVLRAVACIAAPPAGVVVTATLQRTLGGRVTRLEFEKALTRRTQVAVPGLRDCGYGGSGLGRPEVSALPIGAEWITLTLEPGDRVVTPRLRSMRYRLSEDELFGFPFVSADGKQCASIVLRPEASEGEKQAAARIAEYFKYYYAGAPDQVVAVNMEVRQGAPAATGPQVVLDGSGKGIEGKPVVSEVQVRREGEQLIVATAKPEQMVQAVLDLLGQLDRKYAYPGTLPWRYHTNALGIVGKYVGMDGRIHGNAPGKG